MMILAAIWGTTVVAKLQLKIAVNVQLNQVSKLVWDGVCR